MPARLAAARAQSVQHGKADHDEGQQQGPARKAEQQVGRVQKPQIAERDREHYDGAQREKQGTDRREREREKPPSSATLEPHGMFRMALAS